jgi:type II secretory pathway predicted ATPase ExeA
MEITEEQKSIIDAVCAGKHVVVTADPGTGKSHVSYELLRNTEDTTVVMIMFNRALCDATVAHVQQMDLDSNKTVSPFTFHGLASSLTGLACHNDRQMSSALEALENGVDTSDWDIRNFTLLIIDEVQDMRPTFFRLVTHLINSVCTERARLRVVLLGDPNQLLYNFYKFNKADVRFLTLGQVLLDKINQREWVNKKLTRSFRTTSSTSEFLKSLLPGNTLVAGNLLSNPVPVTLVLCNIYDPPANQILELISEYQPEDVMVLCGSLNPNSPAKNVVRALTRANIPVHVGRSGSLAESCPASSKILRGKVRFKTFCASKGLEAKLVVVLSQRELFANMENSKYVAITRSLEKLVIYHDANTSSWEEVDGLKSVKVTALQTVQSTRHVLGDAVSDRPVTKRVEDIFCYMDSTLSCGLEEKYDIAGSTVDTAFVDEDDSYIDSLDVLVSDGYYTNVANIVGTAARLLVEYTRTGVLPRSLLPLTKSTDPRVCTLFTNAVGMLRTCGNDDRLRLQAFAILAMCLDASIGFDEKVGLTDCTWIMTDIIHLRVVRLLTQLNKHVPVGESTQFTLRKTVKVDRLNIVSQPLLSTNQVVFDVIHRPTTCPEDVLVLALHVVAHGKEIGFLSNLFTGELLKVVVPSNRHTGFLRDVCSSSCREEARLGVDEFILKFAL